MRLGKMALVAALIATTTACMPVKDYGHLFKEADFQWSKGQGTSTIKGQAFARTYGGDVKSCAALEIVLAPATAYTDAIADALAEGYTKFAPHPAGYSAFARTAMGDGTGGFEFAGVPAGSWYVGCNLRYMLVGPYGGSETGLFLLRRVAVKPGETVTVLVTPEHMQQPKPVARRPGANCQIWC